MTDFLDQNWEFWGPMNFLKARGNTFFLILTNFFDLVVVLFINIRLIFKDNGWRFLFSWESFQWSPKNFLRKSRFLHWRWILFFRALFIIFPFAELFSTFSIGCFPLFSFRSIFYFFDQTLPLNIKPTPPLTLPLLLTNSITRL